MHKTFLIADTHWKHAWYSRELRQEEQYIENWNTVVGEHDTVFHLGDVALNKRAFPRLKHLNGHKILITGNHDGYPRNVYADYFAEIHQYYLLGDILLTHAPVCPMWRKGATVMDFTNTDTNCQWWTYLDHTTLYNQYAHTIRANIHGHFHQYGISTFNASKHKNMKYHKSVPYRLFSIHDTLIELPQLLTDIETAA